MTNLSTIIHAAKTPLTFDLSEAASIVMLIENALRGDQGPVARGIMNMIDSDTPHLKIINDIQQIADNNYMLVSGILGEVLTDTIVNF